MGFYGDRMLLMTRQHHTYVGAEVGVALLVHSDWYVFAQLQSYPATIGSPVAQFSQV